jgi:hypothetical protein
MFKIITPTGYIPAVVKKSCFDIHHRPTSPTLIKSKGLKPAVFSRSAINLLTAGCEIPSKYAVFVTVPEVVEV